MSIEVLGGLMFKIAFMALLGYLMRRRGLITDDFQGRLSTILLNVVIPISVIGTGNAEFDRAMAQNLGWTALFTLCFYTVAVAVMLALRPAMKTLSRENKNLFANLGILGNTAYIGIPIVTAVYGHEGALYAIIVNLGFQLVAYTLCARLMGGAVSVKKFFSSPMTLCPIIAVLIFVSPFRLPAFMVSTCQDIGALSAPFSMFIIGSALACIPFSSLWKDPHAWLVFGLRQLFFPALTTAALWLAGFGGVLAGAAVLMSGMPPATLNVIFAQQYNADLPFATRSVVLGTTLMLFTLPLWVAVGSALFM